MHDIWPERRPPLVAYVGQTSDVKRRLLQHLGVVAGGNPALRALAERVEMHFSFALVTYEIDRTSIEAGLIRLLRPPLNVLVPTQPPVLTNLPPIRRITPEGADA